MSNLRRSLRIARNSELATNRRDETASTAPDTENTENAAEHVSDMGGIEPAAKINTPTPQSRSITSASSTTDVGDDESPSSNTNAARSSQDRMSSSDFDITENEVFVGQYHLVWCRDIRHPEANLLTYIDGNMEVSNENDPVPVETSTISPTPEPPQDSNDAKPTYISLPARDKATIRLIMTALVLGEDMQVNFSWDYKPRYATQDGRPVYTEGERSGHETRERENFKTEIERVSSSSDENPAGGQDHDSLEITIVNTQLRDRNNALFVEWHMDCPSSDRTIIGFMKKDSANTNYGVGLSASERSRIDEYFANVMNRERSAQNNASGATDEQDRDAPVWYTESMRILRTS